MSNKESLPHGHESASEAAARLISQLQETLDGINKRLEGMRISLTELNSQLTLIDNRQSERVSQNQLFDEADTQEAKILGVLIGEYHDLIAEFETEKKEVESRLNRLESAVSQINGLLSDVSAGEQ